VLGDDEVPGLVDGLGVEATVRLLAVDQRRCVGVHRQVWHSELPPLPLPDMRRFSGAIAHIGCAAA
jgi:hypothetical protein